MAIVEFISLVHPEFTGGRGAEIRPWERGWTLEFNFINHHVGHGLNIMKI